MRIPLPSPVEIAVRVVIAGAITALTAISVVGGSADQSLSIPGVVLDTWTRNS